MNIETLKSFCGTDETRIALALPFTIGEFTYATDGRMIVRVPAMQHEPNPHHHPKNLDKIFDQFPKVETPWTPLAPIDYSEKYKECESCDGSGFCTCDCGHKHDCHACNDGQILELQTKDIAHRRFNLKFIAKISQLPNCQIAENFGSEIAPLAFKFDGGDGLVMPMRKDGNE